MDFFALDSNTLDAPPAAKSDEQRIKSDAESRIAVLESQARDLDKRLQEAQRMIYEGEKNISAIAYELGYAHPQHFHRAFKKQFGVTPGSLLK